MWLSVRGFSWQYFVVVFTLCFVGVLPVFVWYPLFPRWHDGRFRSRFGVHVGNSIADILEEAWR